MILALSLLIGISVALAIEWKHIRPSENKKEFWTYVTLMTIAIVLIILQETVTLPSLMKVMQNIYGPLYTMIFNGEN